MSRPQDRRGFLRGLAGLPLIGGSVALIGSPTAAAVQPTYGMLATYTAWLDGERRHVAWAAGFGGMVPCMNPGHAFHSGDPVKVGQAAMARAPVVLSAVGCRLTCPEAEEMWGPAFAGPAPSRQAFAPAERTTLLDQYESWLLMEASRVARELRGPGSKLLTHLHGPAFEWHRDRPETSNTAERAALILAAVRCPWRRAAW